VYSVTPPHDTPIGKTRAVTYCDFYPAGPDGNGSTTTPGVAWMASAASPTVAMASVDLTKGGSLAPPVTLDKLHYLFVPRAPGKAGANDFYFINQLVSGSYPIELNDVANNKYEGAEELAPTDNPNGGTSFFVEGNLTPAKTDMDHYSVAIPTGATNLAVFCSAQRSGSGLRDLTVTVLNDDGSATTGLALETPDNGATIQQLAIPADTKKLIIQLKAGSQAADVTGDYYRCGIAATAP
jgi:hypothetical protein